MSQCVQWFYILLLLLPFIMDWLNKNKSIKAFMVLRRYMMGIWFLLISSPSRNWNSRYRPMNRLCLHWPCIIIRHPSKGEKVREVRRKIGQGLYHFSTHAIRTAFYHWWITRGAKGTLKELLDDADELCSLPASNHVTYKTNWGLPGIIGERRSSAFFSSGFHFSLGRSWISKICNFS